MPPLICSRHGQTVGGDGTGGLPAGTPLFDRNFITDQTLYWVTSPLGSALWGFVVDEGFGSAAVAGASLWYFPGDLPRQRQTWEVKYNAHLAGGSWGGLARVRYHTGATADYYFLRVNDNANVRLSRVLGGAITNLDSQAITPLLEGEIYQTILTTDYDVAAGTQTLGGEYLTRALLTNSPGAANYNLNAVGDPCYLRIEIDGTDYDVEFISTDPLIANFLAVTNAEVAAVINDQFPLMRAWVPAAATYVAVSSNAFGAAGSITFGAPGTLPDANTALLFPTPTAAVVGDHFNLAAADTSFLVGYNGFRGGYVADTATYLRRYTLEGF